MTNMFLSPLHASDDILKKLPPVRILVGNEDGFYDDCWKYMKCLKEAKVDCEMFIYKNVRHGILT